MGAEAATDAAPPQKLCLAGVIIEPGSISVAGQETCIILPQLKLVLDTGRCPQRAVYQQTVLLSHAHLDHIGGVPFHVSTRCMLGLPPSVIVLPEAVAEAAAQLLAAYRALDGSSLDCLLVPLGPGYVIYSRKQKLRPELAGLPSAEIRRRKLAGEEVTVLVEVPEVAFTGDTSSDFITHPGNRDALHARLLIMELTFLDDDVTVQHAQAFGHMHISEFVQHADRFQALTTGLLDFLQNEAILLTHFSQRYSAQKVVELLDAALPPELRQRCTPLLAGFR